MTDASGRLVSFKNAVIVLTTNVGAEESLRGGIGFTSDSAALTRAFGITREALKDRFRPELLNRLDEICLFSPLSLDLGAKIAHLELEKLRTRVNARGVKCAFADNLAENIAKLTWNSLEGARSIRRGVERLVEQALAVALLTEKRPEKLSVGVREGKIVVE